jgi:hypothetical protein
MLLVQLRIAGCFQILADEEMEKKNQNFQNGQVPHL